MLCALCISELSALLDYADGEGNMFLFQLSDFWLRFQHSQSTVPVVADLMSTICSSTYASFQQRACSQGTAYVQYGAFMHSQALTLINVICRTIDHTATAVGQSLMIWQHSACPG